MSFKEKISFVAGSSKGIGFAVAEKLASLGSNLFLVARSEELLKRHCEYFENKYQVKANFLASNLSTLEGVEKAINSAFKAYPYFDVLIINNGGPKSGLPLQVIDEESFFETYNQTLMSAIRLIRGIIPSMIERKYGRVIAISSISVFEPIDNLTLSNTFRTALASFLKTLSIEVGKYNITVNSVCPGYIKTERLIELAKLIAQREGKDLETILLQLAETTALKRIGKPEEIADAVAFLASDNATFITGVSLPVDGGKLKGTLY